MRRALPTIVVAVTVGLLGLGFPATADAAPYAEHVASTSASASDLAPALGQHAGLDKVKKTKKTKKKVKKKTAAKLTSVKAPGLSLAECTKVANTAIVYLPSGWDIHCAADLGKGINGWTKPGSRQIIVKTGMTLAKTKAVVAHEQSHVWSLTFLTESQKTWFSQRIGKKSFFDGTITTMPAEIWAASQAACAGYPQGPYKRVPCSLLSETSKH